MENAAFLKAHFAGDEEVEAAAKLLEDAGGYYGEAARAVPGSVEGEANVEEVVALLLRAASTEEEAGKILVAKGEAQP